MLLDLFLTFFRIGAFTFGGGYAMISVIEDICVTRKQWITHEDLVNVTVIAESTPGPVAINCATFVGYMQDMRNDPIHGLWKTPHHSCRTEHGPGTRLIHRS